MSGKVGLRKLDKRYKGVDYWTHRLELNIYGDYDARVKRLVKVHEVRCMLTANFGAGCHVDEAYCLQRNDVDVPVWGFNNDGEFFVRGESLVLMELSRGRWEK
jgi:hypothetical protein